MFATVPQALNIEQLQQWINSCWNEGKGSGWIVYYESGSTDFAIAR